MPESRIRPAGAVGSSGLRIALIGTRGVPAKYGGFETCVEEVGSRLASLGHDVTVYCRSSSETSPDEYLGMRLIHLPSIRRRSLETLSHTGLSVNHLLWNRTDVAIVFNAANAPWLPVIRAAGIPVATHVDGLEWKRAKWGKIGKRYYRSVEALAVRWSDALIADAKGIQAYYRERFDASTEYLAYGAPILDDAGSEKVREIGLEPSEYHLVVARLEPENHVHLIVDGYRRSSARLPLVIVGTAPYAPAYIEKIRSLADDRVRFLGGVWDQKLLDQLYANALVYWHGHSVGGTNPSLLRAIGAGAATNAFDVDFNSEVLGDAGRYFAESEDVVRLVEAAERDRQDCETRGLLAREAAGRYDWDDVALRYETLCYELHDRGRRPGRRRAVTAPTIAAPSTSAAAR
ncbi:glycosyltransferase family 1 protein [Arthrobacter echini]|uniref:Glycosyltransferase family 1 protein n=1 Tax=Arthrobacter echini TaxID=1529066 RepID=A0A4S5E849_9MICC|nr:DUF1972 domain-containing protein [Arthrobacter echini]THJ67846.1 glycosyltransferase family 1 protein [Arthrobacter echini]